MNLHFLTKTFSCDEAPIACTDGTHRIQSPDQTLARVQPFMRLMQITRLANITGLDYVWVPLEIVHTNYTFEARIGAGIFAATSNGLASGNHILEAVSHGICEVVERDATTLWELSGETKKCGTRIDLGTIEDPCCAMMLQ